MLSEPLIRPDIAEQLCKDSSEVSSLHTRQTHDLSLHIAQAPALLLTTRFSNLCNVADTANADDRACSNMQRRTLWC